MDSELKISSALISVYSKVGLEPIVKKMNDLGIKLYSTGGTGAYIKDLGIDVTFLESITEYPSILGGRVKTLHPKIFGGILNRRNSFEDQNQVQAYDIPKIDVVIVDLYPFEDTVNIGADEDEIIEKIDIGGISLIRAASKNFKDVMCVPSVVYYGEFLELISKNEGVIKIESRKLFASRAFNISSHYDTAIFNYLNTSEDTPLKLSFTKNMPLRYGENPHQKSTFFGDLSKVFEQLHGKTLSYNNLLDVDVALSIMSEFTKNDATFAILKHNNACGIASSETIKEAYIKALESDPVSAFGGILISNKAIDTDTANEINKLFFEVLIAPNYIGDSLIILTKKRNRIILKHKEESISLNKQIRSCLNGVLSQDRDVITDNLTKAEVVTNQKPNNEDIRDMEFASKVCKHTKSNAIVLAKDNRLLALGTGQTSRVEALRQAIKKAKEFNFDLSGSTMASDAFFPFPDCVVIAAKERIKNIVQPGGSIKDLLSIDACNKHNISMAFTKTRHFKH